ncbi:hypothetical protein [Seonamhaeicola sp.]|uniref:hypothetical protein n=1 Tax=Seonamhaeicola sp. TaxID=1912245 RepID=UPI0026077E48|nr:hypothetical protein [Seonamhaeicola sp.]
MTALKQLLNFYINSSIHVALAVSSLTWITLMEFQIPFDKSLLFFVFFASVTGYNFVKYFGLAKFHHRRLANWLKMIQIFSFFCFVLMCFYALKLETKTLLYILGFGAITFFYAIPFLPKHFFVDKQQNLRSIGGLKIYLIALVWSGVTVFLPFINNDIAINTDVFITAVQRYIYIIVLMFPFEIRDLRFDNLKLSTIPQKIGVKRTKAIGAMTLIVLLMIEFFKEELSVKRLVVLVVVVICTLLALLFAKIEQGKYYSAFWVEGLPILWLGLLLMFN